MHSQIAFICPRVHGTRCTHLNKKYALSRSRTESGLDAGISQAEALGTDECARVSDIRVFCRACTRTFTRLPAKDGKNRPPTRTREDRFCAKSSTQHPQNCAGPGAHVSIWVSRFPGMPVLLQHRLQFTRNTVQLLSRWKKMRAAEIGTVTGDFSTVTVALAFRDLLGN